MIRMGFLKDYLMYNWNKGALIEKRKLIKRLIEEERMTQNKVNQYKSNLRKYEKKEED